MGLRLDRVLLAKLEALVRDFTIRELSQAAARGHDPDMYAYGLVAAATRAALLRGLWEGRAVISEQRQAVIDAALHAAFTESTP